MLERLNRIRTPEAPAPMSTRVARTVGLLVFGLAIGAAAKLLDIYTINIGEIFSRLSVWVFICSFIAAYSASPQRAAVNVFAFCGGMLAAYYLTAELTSSIYSMRFVAGWAVFALFSPLFAAVVWYARGRGAAAKLITCAAAAVMLLAAALLFDGVRISDVALASATVGLLIQPARRRRTASSPTSRA